MTLSAQISRPSTEGNLHIVALLSTETGRRNAMLSSSQCLLSVVGSLGIILLFAGIPQLIYSPVVTATNVVIFLVGALLLSIMVAGNACISYRFRPDLNHITGPLEEAADRPVEDKPPSYDDLSFLDGAPPDYFSVVCDSKSVTNSVSSASVEVAPTHAGGRTGRHKSLSRETSGDNQWSSASAEPLQRSLVAPNDILTNPEGTDFAQTPGTNATCVMRSERSTYPDIFAGADVPQRGLQHTSGPPLSVLVSPDARSHRNVDAVRGLSYSIDNRRIKQKSDSAASSPDSQRSFIQALKESECPYPLSATDAEASSLQGGVTAPLAEFKLNI